MKLLVLGASGQCGQWAARLAVQRGYAVTALVRPATAFTPPPSVTLIRGEALSASDVSAAMIGHDAVLSCLGPQRQNPSNPFSPLKSPPHFCERSAEVIAAAARAAGVRRLGAISAAGVADSEPLLPGAMRWLLRHSTIGPMYADLSRMEQVYAASGLDWFAVRPVTLLNASPSARAKQVPRFRAVSVIGRADVAAFMLAMLDAPDLTHSRTPFIGWW